MSARTAPTLPRRMLADALRRALPRERYRVDDALQPIDELLPGQRAVAIGIPRVTPYGGGAGIRSYGFDVWLVTAHRDFDRAADDLETGAAELLRYLEQLPIEATWSTVEYDQYDEQLYHAYRIALDVPLETRTT